jgi:hypothetical protein
MTSVGVYHTAEPTGDQRALTLPPLRPPPPLPDEEYEGDDERGGSYDEYDGDEYEG